MAWNLTARMHAQIRTCAPFSVNFLSTLKVADPKIAAKSAAAAGSQVADALTESFIRNN
jgi:hypothetical protein